MDPIAATKQYGVAPQHTKYKLKHAGIKGYEKTRMQIMMIRKINAAILPHSNRGTMTQARGNPPQAGGPSTKGPADSVRKRCLF